jgi:hypothetical protein
MKVETPKRAWLLPGDDCGIWKAENNGSAEMEGAVEYVSAALLDEAYALGFDASGEGFNGEFPLDGNHRNVADWRAMRDRDLATLKGDTP